MDWLRGMSAHDAVTRPGDPSVKLGERHLPVAIRRNGRARRMTMRLAPDGSEVRITLPRWGRAAEALAFARSRADWLEGQLATIPAPAPPRPGGTLAYRGHILAIDWDERHPRRPAIDADRLRIGGPAESLTTRLARWLKQEAVLLLQQDLAIYCARAAVPLPDLRLSNAQRRWGSCSGTGTIRINWRLIQAPDPVRRSVVAHEVAHLVHFNHSPAFHALLASIYEGDLKTADRWLRLQGRGLYSAFS